MGVRPSAARESTVVLAVKALGDAKSRLRPLPPAHDDRPALVIAMLTDTLSAVTAARPRRVVVVSPDARVHTIASDFGAVTVDEPTARLEGWTALNAALAHGASEFDGPIAYLQADLPAMRPESLQEALDEASDELVHAPAAFVSDRAGTGTALLVAGPSFRPLFGVDSAAAHRTAAAVELDPGRTRWPDLRTDIDTPEDLAVARAIGLGAATSELLLG
ncbi:MULTISPECIES: 2-phospho-L-lactate guanylyltransferase [unclassified Gordonia (in: high G+C Gram-positive bacteria)]|uniref:2-phospho-L-lactate guanylyltransferase n=1 Tax=unclassified Gordonia (in: high G+C Gram-positive bacteria) TaxID=2657482 RepID=UPI001F05C918|nr:2-phospho-L-lactate guanylyltransferase [Gordonia sp. PDNC005]